MQKKSSDVFIDSLTRLGTIDDDRLPVDQWNPDVIGEIDIRIDREGEWFYQGAKITRKEMVKLFSSILRLDSDNVYYLVSPVEKMKINVEVAPFSVIDFRIIQEQTGPLFVFLTNIDEEVLLNRPGKLIVDKRDNGEPIPLLTVRKNLNGLINRNVFYRLVALSEVQEIAGVSYLGVWSGGDFYIIDHEPGEAP